MVDVNLNIASSKGRSNDRSSLVAAADVRKVKLWLVHHSVVNHTSFVVIGKGAPVFLCRRRQCSSEHLWLRGVP